MPARPDVPAGEHGLAGGYGPAPCRGRRPRRGRHPRLGRGPHHGRGRRLSRLHRREFRPRHRPRRPGRGVRAIPFLDAAAVHRRAPWDRLIEALEAAHRRPRILTGHLRLMQERADRQPDVLILAPAWDDGNALGVKLVTSFPGNPARGLSTVGSVYVVFDPASGKPRMLLDGEALIFRKTAADTALGGRLRSRPGARRLLMLGAGALAPHVIAAVRHVRPGIDDIRIWNRTPAKAEALAAACRAQGLPAAACTDAGAAQAEADIIIAATMAEVPIVQGARLRPGTHVGLI